MCNQKQEIKQVHKLRIFLLDLNYNLTLIASMSAIILVSLHVHILLHVEYMPIKASHPALFQVDLGPICLHLEYQYLKAF